MDEDRTPGAKRLPAGPDGREGDSTVSSRARRMDRQRSYQVNGPGCMVPITIGGAVALAATRLVAALRPR